MGVPRFATMQNHYNVIYREEEREMLPLCRDEGIGVIPWSPLARGFVMGARRRDDGGATVRARSDDYGHSVYCQPSDFDMVNRITEVARNRGVSNARIALAWVAQQPGVTAPIFGASKPGHLEDDVAALDIKLDDSELNALAEPYQPHRASDFRALSIPDAERVGAEKKNGDALSPSPLFLNPIGSSRSATD